MQIIDLDKPEDPPKILYHASKWEVPDIQWNPHSAKENHIATIVILFYKKIFLISHLKKINWNCLFLKLFIFFFPQSNQKALIWNIENPSKPVEYVLHAHNRSVSDLNWSVFDPNVIATSSVDSYVHIWDLREPSKPTSSLCAWTSDFIYLFI